MNGLRWDRRREVGILCQPDRAGPHMVGAPRASEHLGPGRMARVRQRSQGTLRPPGGMAPKKTPLPSLPAKRRRDRSVVLKSRHHSTRLQSEQHPRKSSRARRIGDRSTRGENRARIPRGRVRRRARAASPWARCAPTHRAGERRDGALGAPSRTPREMRARFSVRGSDDPKQISDGPKGESPRSGLIPGRGRSRQRAAVRARGTRLSAGHLRPERAGPRRAALQRGGCERRRSEGRPRAARPDPCPPGAARLSPRGGRQGLHS